MAENSELLSHAHNVTVPNCRNCWYVYNFVYIYFALFTGLGMGSTVCARPTFTQVQLSRHGLRHYWSGQKAPDIVIIGQ